MQVKDIMTTQTEFIAADASFRDAAEAMDEHDIGFLPVRDGGQLVGVLTDRDLALRPALNHPANTPGTVGDIMTPKAHAVRSHTPLTGAAMVMRQKGVRRLLVLDEQEQLVGVVSLSDIAKKSRESDLPSAVLRHLAAVRSRTAPARTSSQR